MKLDYCKCKHCKYFIQHYGMGLNSIHEVCCGNCTKQPNPNITKVYSGKQPCPYFEQKKENITKNQKYITELLEHLSYNTECLKLFLNKRKSSQPISDVVINHLNRHNQ